ncbi:MAG: hypothetical protein ABI151_05125 [Chitinophagaceae bacterium]
MRLVSAINQRIWLLIVFSSLLSLFATAQENSPYSRFGLGDILPNASIVNRSMGGISAAYMDYDKRYEIKDGYLRSQTINFTNPATYSRMKITSFDLGFEVDSRTIRSIQEVKKFNSVSPIISYVQLGIPLVRKRNLGMIFGLRPITRINYKIGESSRLSGIDSISTLYKGTGGTYQVYTGLGKSFGKLSVGFNAGYMFGNKDYSSKRAFIPDSAFVTYMKSNFEQKTNIGGLFFDMGVHYRTQLTKKVILSLGAYGNVSQQFNLNRNVLAETFEYDANGAVQPYDTVSYIKNQKGKLIYPSKYGIGFTIESPDKWLIGVDYTAAKWSDYRFYGQPDALSNTWTIKVGGQIIPNAYNPKSYWSRVTYRAGFNFGPDYIAADGKLPQFGFSAGAGFPIRKNVYTNQYTSINFGLEYGKRGNNNNPLSENTFRVSMGLTLSDLWFIKKKYF